MLSGSSLQIDVIAHIKPSLKQNLRQRNRNQVRMMADGGSLNVAGSSSTDAQKGCDL